MSDENIRLCRYLSIENVFYSLTYSYGDATTIVAKNENDYNWQLVQYAALQLSRAFVIRPQMNILEHIGPYELDWDNVTYISNPPDLFTTHSLTERVPDWFTKRFYHIIIKLRHITYIKNFSLYIKPNSAIENHPKNFALSLIQHCRKCIPQKPANYSCRVELIENYNRGSLIVNQGGNYNYS